MALYPILNLKTFRFINANSTYLAISLLNIVYLVFFFLTTVNNLISFVFILEFINLIVISFLACSLTNQLGRVTSTAVSGNTLVIFFWINTISSIMLFSFLTFFTFFGHALNFSTTGPLTLLSASYLGSAQGSIFNTLLLLIFLFKLGTPPFIFWKFFLFEKTPLFFIYVYNLPYFIFLLLGTLYLINVFGISAYGKGSVTVLLLLVVGMLHVVTLFSKTTAWGPFFAISSALTSLLLLFFAVQAAPNPVQSVNPLVGVSNDTLPLVLYLTLYALTTFTLVLTLLSLGIG